MTERKLEVCLTPAVYSDFENSNAVVVIIDVLRASSSICTAFENGAKSIIPVADVDEAKRLKSEGYRVAAERDGFVLDFADFGNSPFNFTRENVENLEIVYSTTNCTRIIKMVGKAHDILIGAFVNISAVCRRLEASDRDVILLCAAWKNKVNIEDTLCAGAIAERLLLSGKYSTICDSVHIATDLWRLAENNPTDFIEKAAQRKRLRDKGLDDCIPFCMTPDLTESVPSYRNGILTDDGLFRHHTND